MELQGLEKLLSHEQKREWQRLYEATDKYTDGWLSAGMMIETNRVVNIHEVHNISAHGHFASSCGFQSASLNVTHCRQSDNSCSICV
jgi:hypothetical protein